MLPVGPLFAVLGLLFGRATAVGTSDVLFLLGFSLYFSFVGVFPFAPTTEVDAILQNALEIVFSCHVGCFNGGTTLRQ